MEKPSQEEKFPGFFHKHIAEVAPWCCFQSQSAPAGLSPRWGVTLSCFAPTLGDGCHAQGNQSRGCCSQTTFPELQSLPRAVSWSSWDKAQAPAFTHIGDSTPAQWKWTLPVISTSVGLWMSIPISWSWVPQMNIRYCGGQKEEQMQIKEELCIHPQKSRQKRSDNTY